MSKNKQIAIYSVVGVIVVVAVVWAFLGGRGPAAPVPGQGTVPQPGGIPSSTTRAAVPPNAVAPNAGESSTPAGVAVPAVQGAGDAAGNVSYRSFNISISGGAYSPSTVIVNQGDTVNLDITAVGAAYGFTQPDYGFDVAIPAGKTQVIQFQALHSGDFTFFCKSCGGPSKGPVGHIVVVTK